MKTIKIASVARLNEILSDVRTGKSHPDVPHPDRTGYKRSGIVGENVTAKVWPSRAALLQTLEMQDKRESRADDWRPMIR